MTRRLTSSSLAGTSRKLVAVGTPRLASMFSTMRAATPRSGSPASAFLAAFSSAFAAGAAGSLAAGWPPCVVGAAAGAAGVGARLRASAVVVPLVDADRPLPADTGAGAAPGVGGAMWSASRR